MRDLPAWRVYVGLPMFGARAPAGGADEFMKLAYEDALINLIAPVIEQAAAELPAVVVSLQKELSIDEGPIGLVGPSAGGAASLLAMVETELPLSAVVLVNPAVRATAIIEVGERMFGAPYAWDDVRRARASRLDFVRRAGEIVARDPQTPILFVLGEDDDSAFLAASSELHEALVAGYRSPESVSLVSVPGLGHALAEEPGIEPAPQSAVAARVDAEATIWLRRRLGR